MKKNKGFTLIELLAVIVILAIIALIATPLILNIINRARKQAFQRSAEGVLKAGKNYYLLGQLEPQGFNKVTFHCEDNKCLSEDNKELEVEGNVGTGYVTIDKQGNVALKLTNGSYCTYKYVSKNNVEIKDGDCSDIEVTSTVLPKTGETFKAIVYLDPTNLNKVCDEKSYEENLNEYYETNQKVATRYDGTEVPSPTGLKTGCMKWYVYDENNDGTVDMILDHNTTARVAWANQVDFEAAGGIWNSTSGSENYNTQGPVTINKELEKLVSESGWKVEPKLIMANEVAHIVGADRSDTINWKSTNTYGVDVSTNQSAWFYLDGKGNSYSDVDGWQKQYATTPNSSNYSWLYNYTYKCTGDTTENGCEIADNNSYNGGNTYGYWSSSTRTNSSSNVWYVHRYGRLPLLSAKSEDNGLRPVITISKSSINL